MKYVIIGASAAGLACAEQIRKEDTSGTITVLSAEAYLPYSRPSISYYLKGIVKEREMLLRKPSFYAQKNIEILTNTRVTAIDTAAKTVRAGRKQFAYDKLCLCMGSVPFIPPMKNVSGKENVFSFLDLAAVKEVKAAAKKDMRAMVIGAGLIGMKAAEGLSKICKKVDVVELAPRILPSILDGAAAKRVQKHVEACGGVQFYLGDSVREAKTDGKKVTGVVLNSGRELACDLLVVAVGVRPNTALAKEAGLDVNRGIIVNGATMQTSLADIYAAGDCVLSHDKLDDSDKIIALWGNAVLQGKVAGSQMAGGTLRICTCGLINAQGKEYKEIVEHYAGAYKHLIIKDNKLVGFVLIDASENAGIYTSLIENGTDLSTLVGALGDTPSLFLFNKESRQRKLKGETI